METYRGMEVTCNFIYCHVFNCRGSRISIYKKKSESFFFHFELSSKFGVVEWLGEGSGVWVFFTSKFRTALRVTQALPTARARRWPMTASWSGCGFLFLHSMGQLVFTLLYHSCSTFTEFLILYLQYSLLLQGLAPSFLFYDYSVFSLFGCSAFLLQTRWHTHAVTAVARGVVYGVTAIALCFGIPSYSYCTQL
jgi:hypothetical protein